MTEITINPVYIFVVIYVTFKFLASLWICKREFQYPIWNKDGFQIQRDIQHKLQSFLRNLAINPEWGLLKLIAFAPVFLMGKRFTDSFMPWRVQKTPPFCRECNDKGKYYVKAFFTDKSGGWQTCHCRNQQIPKEPPNCLCYVCLDERTIGRNRPCPHCERREILEYVASGCAKCAKCDRRFSPAWGTDLVFYKWCSDCYKVKNETENKRFINRE